MALYLREAGIEDRDLLFKWANDTLVRENSFSSRMITYDEHIWWFDNIMKRTDCIQYILMDGELPIGQARVSVEKESAEVGYSICKEKRGKGYGCKLLKLVSEEIKNNFPNILKVTGKVKTENVASQKTFINAGYVELYQVFEMEIK